MSDIPENDLLPNGQKVVIGHRTLCTGGKVYLFVCPICQRHVAKLYKAEMHFACRLCVNLPYKSAISGRVERAAVAMTTHPEQYDAIQERLRRDCLHDADTSNTRYREKMRAKRQAREQRPAV